MSEQVVASIGDESSSIQLRIHGRQFPGVSGWDGEWLIVECQAKLGDQSWAFRSSCLLAGELASLIAWLRAIADERDGILDPRLEFMEPTIGFSFERMSSAEILLAVEFTLEGSPPWWDSMGHQSGEGLRPFVISMKVGPDELRRAAADLESTAPDV